eukprot:15330047-Ditylum_brightwellii.AAC.1
MKRKKDSSAIATEGSLSASTSTYARAAERDIPLVASLERCIHRSRCATVEKNKSDESQSNYRSNLDEDGNAYDASIDNVASDKKDRFTVSDDFYTSILSGDWGCEV